MTKSCHVFVEIRLQTLNSKHILAVTSEKSAILLLFKTNALLSINDDVARKDGRTTVHSSVCTYLDLGQKVSRQSAVTN